MIYGIIYFYVSPCLTDIGCYCRAGGLAAGYAAADPVAEVDGQGISGGLSLLAHALAAVVGQLGVRLDTFSVGPVAHQIGRCVLSPLLCWLFGGST